MHNPEDFDDQDSCKLHHSWVMSKQEWNELTQIWNDKPI